MEISDVDNDEDKQSAATVDADGSNNAVFQLKEEDDDEEVITLGGKSETPCFALLDGIFEDPQDPTTKTRVTIPITRLPAVLGRTHDTDDPHFFGLGKKKALSRKQCLIEYRVPSFQSDGGDDSKKDGRVEWDEKQQKLVYKETTENENSKKDDNGNDDSQDIDIDELPSEGYFAIGSMGKNRIMVDQERIGQGKVALLKSGTPIRISSYMLYFLLPTDAKPLEHTIETEEVDDPPLSTMIKKKKGKKRKKSDAVLPDNAPSSSDATGNNKKGKTTVGANFQAELDSMTVEELMNKMEKAIRDNEWDRKSQIVGSTIAMHAVRAVAMDPSIQTIAVNEGGVSRKVILDWIETSSQYADWVEQMLTKMELRSYQAAVTKSLLRAGYTKTGGFGRYVKWFLPEDIKIVVTKKEANEDESDVDGEDQNEGDDDQEEDNEDGESSEGEEEEEEEEGEDNEEEEDVDEEDEDDENDGGDTQKEEEDVGDED